MATPAKPLKLDGKARVGSHLLDITLPVAVVAVAAGVVLGVMQRDRISGLSGNVKAATRPADQTARQAADKIQYTCGMHPWIIMDEPGPCPICQMPMQPIHTHATPAGQVQIDPAIVQNMGVRTAMPVRGELNQQIRALGTLTEPEENHREINLRVSGWIEKLYANQEGAPVNAGDPLFDLYSPEITAAADELIAARKSGETMTGADAALLGKSSDALIAAARRRLELMGIAGEDIAAIEKMDKAPATVTFRAPIHGHIAAKMIIEGSAVKAGDALMKIADLSTMWMILQVYEQQLATVKAGEKVHATIPAAPGKEFEGTVDFVYPHLDPATRTASVRVLLPNASHDLHENMFAEAVIDASTAGKPALLVPREAVIDSGVRQVVYVALGGGKFAAHDVKIGAAGAMKTEPDASASDAPANQYVEILTGLTEEDTVVTSGQFLLDSESRLEEARRKLSTPVPQNMPADDVKVSP